MRQPPYELLCEWIVAAWQSVRTEIIIHSFLCCGISVDVSGNQDKLVSVFKREDCSDGLRLLAESHANRIATAQFSPAEVDSDFE